MIPSVVYPGLTQATISPPSSTMFNGHRSPWIRYLIAQVCVPRWRPLSPASCGRGVNAPPSLGERTVLRIAHACRQLVVPSGVL